MADKKNPKPGKGEDEPVDPSAEGFEGPDVETSLTAEDLAFLAGASTAEEIDESEPESEHLADLKRVQAEFANYRKRVERDRQATRDSNVAEVVKNLLPVLDDLTLAEAHGDLDDGPMAVIAQKLRASLDKFGLVMVGVKGDVFDPNLHEALVQLPTKGVTVNTVADVIAPGYKLGDRLLRPAKVAVAVPQE